jgi:hypothetical protein
MIKDYIILILLFTLLSDAVIDDKQIMILVWAVAIIIQVANIRSIEKLNR